MRKIKRNVRPRVELNCARLLHVSLEYLCTTTIF